MKYQIWNKEGDEFIECDDVADLLNIVGRNFYMLEYETSEFLRRNQDGLTVCELRASGVYVDIYAE